MAKHIQVQSLSKYEQIKQREANCCWEQIEDGSWVQNTQDKLLKQILETQKEMKKEMKKLKTENTRLKKRIGDGTKKAKPKTKEKK